MYTLLNLIFNIALIGTIGIYIFMIIKDIEKLKKKVAIYLTSIRQKNEIVVLPILMTFNFFILYISPNRKLFEKIIIVVCGIIIVSYWTYRAFSKPRICEHIIITHEYIYLAEHYISHEWSRLIEDRSLKLWIKLKRKSFFGRDTEKEGYFILAHEQKDKIQEILHIWENNKIIIKKSNGLSIRSKGE